MRIKLDIQEFDNFKVWWLGSGKDKTIRSLAKMTHGNVMYAFRNQGRDGEWPRRGAPNVAGIIRRVNEQENPRYSDFVPAPALIDSGALKNSFKFMTTRDGFSVYTDSPYASKQQRGLVDRLKLTPIGRRHLAMFLKGASPSIRSMVRKEIGWMLNKKRKRKPYKIKPHARKMLFVDARDEADLKAAIAKIIHSFKEEKTEGPSHPAPPEGLSINIVSSKKPQEKVSAPPVEPTRDELGQNISIVIKGEKNVGPSQPASVAASSPEVTKAAQDLQDSQRARVSLRPEFQSGLTSSEVSEANRLMRRVAMRMGQAGPGQPQSQGRATPERSSRRSGIRETFKHYTVRTSPPGVFPQVFETRRLSESQISEAERLKRRALERMANL